MEPQEPHQPAVEPPPRTTRRGITGGIVLIALGVLFLLNNFLPDFRIGDYWPLILVAVGVGLLLKGRRT